METNIKKIWGITITEIQDSDFLIWRLGIDRPFRKDNKWWIGIGAKLIYMATRAGVNKFLIQIGQREIFYPVPTEKELKQKRKRNEFEWRKSLFKNSPPIRIYHFGI